MFEFHGWATIRDNTSETNDDISAQIVDKIENQISSFNWDRGILEIKAVNGEYHLVVSGFTNHKSQEADEVFSLFQYISDIAPGSYGILNVRDDEDANGKNNVFQVFVLTRGKFTEREDCYLSPVVPVIEDP